jgi:hypothetical protein
MLVMMLGSIAASTAACVGPTSQDQNAIVTSARLNEAALLRLDGGPARADVLGALCEELAVLRRNKVDAGTGAVPCP